jgi:Tol biopolymer transport system component
MSMNRSTTTPRSFTTDQLHAALGDVGGPARPDYLLDIVAEAGRMRQRPGWTFPERWLSMDIAAPRQGVPRTAILSATLVLLALAAAAGLYIGSQPTPPVDVTPSPHESTVPSITRLDGEVLQFTGEQSNGVGDLIAVHPETGATRVLLEDVEDIASASWSADGSWIAYKKTSGDLWVVGSDRMPRQLTGNATGEAVGRPWTWSPDGARLAVHEASGVFIFDASTGQRTDIGAGGSVWSPDGRRLLDGASGGSIYSIDVRTKERSLLVQLPGENLETVDEMEWSPDGSRLAILNDLNPGLHRLFVLNADGSGIRVLAEDAAVSGLDWSPDGTQVAFTESSDAEIRIWVAPANGSTATLVGSQPNLDDDGGDPVWSPDGSRVAFWSEPDEAFVIDADGSSGVAPLDALTYEHWRGGWFECGTCLSFRSGF